MSVKPQYALEEINDRIKSTVLVVGRTPVLHKGMWLVGNTLFEHLHQAGLANPRLTTEQDHLSHAISHMPPAFVKQGHFRVAPHERCQTMHRRHLKSMLQAAFCSRFF